MVTEAIRENISLMQTVNSGRSTCWTDELTWHLVPDRFSVIDGTVTGTSVASDILLQLRTLFFRECPVEEPLAYVIDSL